MAIKKGSCKAKAKQLKTRRRERRDDLSGNEKTPMWRQLKHGKTSAARATA